MFVTPKLQPLLFSNKSAVFVKKISGVLVSNPGPARKSSMPTIANATSASQWRQKRKLLFDGGFTITRLGLINKRACLNRQEKSLQNKRWPTNPCARTLPCVRTPTALWSSVSIDSKFRWSRQIAKEPAMASYSLSWSARPVFGPTTSRQFLGQNKVQTRFESPVSPDVPARVPAES